MNSEKSKFITVAVFDLKLLRNNFQDKQDIEKLNG
jgi:hypothetical protein